MTALMSTVNNTLIPAKTRILLIDNDQQVGNDLVEILESVGYKVAFVFADGESISEIVRKRAKEFRPHVAIIDLRLLDDYLTNDISGLTIAEHIRPAQAILYSANLSVEVTSKAMKNGFADWVAKYDSPEVLLDAVQLAAKLVSSVQNTQMIYWPQYWDSASIIRLLFKEGEKVYPCLVNDLIFQMLETTQEVRPGTITGNIANKPALTNGNSVVIKVRPDDRLPAVLKISSATRISDEHTRYTHFVNQKLPGQFHTLLLGSKVFWDIGGILYSFMGTDETIMPTFADHYRNSNDPQKIVQPLRHFFTKVWYQLYEQFTIKKDQQLIDEYDVDWKLRDRLKQRFKPQEELNIVCLGVRVEHPGAWLRNHTESNSIKFLKIAVVHGDFHGNNLFVDSDHTWAIDFERTGPSHILRDFVELEVDILTRLLPEHISDKQFIELLFQLTQRHDKECSSSEYNKLAEIELEKAYTVIVELRKLARIVTHLDDLHEYWWALLFNAIYVAIRKGSSPEMAHRAELMAAVICERLKHPIHGEWPPKSLRPKEIKPEDISTPISIPPP